jgi:hypothetical protein
VVGRGRGIIGDVRLGIADHLGWAVADTASADYEVIDRRQILADLAHARDWRVHLYDAKRVETQAAAILTDRADDVLQGPRATLGPPWTKDHRIALAATIVGS